MTNRQLLVAITLLAMLSSGVSITLMLRANANASLIRRLTQDIHELRTIHIPNLEHRLRDHQQQLERLHLQFPATAAVPIPRPDTPPKEATEPPLTVHP